MSRSKANTDPTAPFQSPTGAARATGMSAQWIREGCQAGTIPHIRVGVDYRVNVPALLAKLDMESKKGVF